MSGQSYEFGIRFTADSRVAVAEAGKVQAAQEGIKQSSNSAAQQVNNLGNALGNLGKH